MTMIPLRPCMSVRRCETISPPNFVAGLPSETLTFATLALTVTTESVLGDTDGSHV